MSDAPDNSTLQEWLRDAAEGDAHAWSLIVEAYFRRVFGLIRKEAGDPELAEEITQSTFCTIVAKLGSYTELGRFEAWLFRIAMNRLRDEMRRRGRQARPVEHDALTGLAGGEEDPEEPPTDDLARMRNAINQLGEADRRVIHLRHNAEMSFAQIAEHLDQPMGTVLARHHRALKKLRTIMEAALTADPEG